MDTLTWREAAAIMGVSSRTVARMVKRGDLATTFTTTGQRRIIRESVMIAQEVRRTGDTTTAEGKAKVDTPLGIDTVMLAADYATLRQACHAVVTSGMFGRRAALAQLRDVLESAPDIRTPPEAPVGIAEATAPTNQADPLLLEEAATDGQ